MHNPTHRAGQKIREYREAHGLSAIELGDKLGGVPEQTIYSWETRGRTPRRCWSGAVLRMQELGICDAQDWLLPATQAA